MKTETFEEDEKIDLSEMNEELLESSLPPQEDPKNQMVRKEKLTGKAYIIDRIQVICEKAQIICPHSPTALKRMKRKDLENLMAELVERGIQKEIEKKIKFERRDDLSDEENGNRLALTALKLVHNTCTQLTERCVESYTPYSIDGFSQSLKNPETEQQLDECLLEICKEREIIQLLNCPYTKLAIIWGGGIMLNLKTKSHYKNVRFSQPMGPKPINKV